MSKKHHGQQQAAQAEVPAAELETKVDLAEAEKEQQEAIEADLNALAEEVEAEVEKKEDPTSFKARMKALKEQQKKEMATLKEEVKKEREKAKAEGKTVKGDTVSVSRNAITAKVISEIDGPVKFDDLAILCDKAYVEASPEGHKSNIREAKTVLRNNLIILPIFTKGAIKVEGDIISRAVTA